MFPAASPCSCGHALKPKPWRTRFMRPVWVESVYVSFLHMLGNTRSGTDRRSGVVPSLGICYAPPNATKAPPTHVYIYSGCHMHPYKRCPSWHRHSPTNSTNTRVLSRTNASVRTKIKWQPRGCTRPPTQVRTHKHKRSLEAPWCFISSIGGAATCFRPSASFNLRLPFGSEVHL